MSDIQIIDAAADVAMWAKTHEWPVAGSPEFFEFTALMDRLATLIGRDFPPFQSRVNAAVKESRTTSKETKIPGEEKLTPNDRKEIDKFRIYMRRCKEWDEGTDYSGTDIAEYQRVRARAHLKIYEELYGKDD